MEETAIATSHRPACLFALIALLVFLLAALGADAANERLAKLTAQKAKRTQERRVKTSRKTESNLAHLRQTEALDLDYIPRQKGYDILIDKSARRMTIFMSGKVYRTYKAHLGFTPEGHKTRRGDGCTPEGRYYICKRNPRSAYYRSLFISYPAPKDAKEGVECGLVGQDTYDAVCRAYERGSAPPMNTRLGGNICIHGEGYKQRPDDDWTAGCIAVTNEEMAEIWSLIPVGTPVTIRP